jgi:hypothetical protein
MSDFLYAILTAAGIPAASFVIGFTATAGSLCAFRFVTLKTNTKETKTVYEYRRQS